ncbi:MAG: hypothetical protein DRG78_24535 [Epsilonproteobacteria bacterium]|nr:MAG: hypothetical protein DRG78_24535 [Campylobacterota bacterium]
MLTIKATLPTRNLPIRRVLAKLFQSFVYHTLDDKEHRGYKHQNGKVFKSMNFKINYIDNDILIKYVAIDKENEKTLATKILLEGLKLGEIHITQTEVSLQNRQEENRTKIKVGGFISAAIKDGTSSKKIYLEPKSHKFQEILYNNTIQKYEALFSKPYSGTLKITLINQKPRERLFHYSKGVMKAWYGVYEIEADSDMLEMILDSGMGANCMKGLGFVEMMS